MAGLEAAGDIITGSLIGRAVEPNYGEGHKAHGACLNCGTALIGAHCHGCGQKAHVHRTLNAYGHELLHGVFHFEGKVWRTLPMLAFKPGELTRRYIHGERAKFVSPLALFLFAVFLMFAVVGGLAGEMHVPDGITVEGNSALDKLKGKPMADLAAALRREQTKKAALDTQIAVAKKTGADWDALDAQLDKVKSEIENIQSAQDFLVGRKPRNLSVSTSIPWIDETLTKNVKENPNLVLYKIQSSAYKYAWALIPLSLPFVWLCFFWKRKFKLYDHAVFITYSLTFMLFLTVILVPLGFLLGQNAAPTLPILGTFIPPIHMYRQLRGAYQVSRIGAALRTFALAVSGIVVLTIFLLALIGLGALG